MKTFLCLAIILTLYMTPTPSYFIQDQDMVYVGGGTIKIDGRTYKNNPLLVDKYEVTMAQFEKFVEATGYKTFAEKNGGAKIWSKEKMDWAQSPHANWRHDLNGREIPKAMYTKLPVSNVCIEDALAYANWAGKRLPYQYEWLFIARGGEAGKKTKYAGSNKADDVAWYDENTYGKKQPVGTKKPNELGVYDMSGNVNEFVLSDDGLYYAVGGSYFSDKELCELKDKGWKVRKTEVFHTYGFRCVKDL